jgi:hypothetical protein
MDENPAGAKPIVIFTATYELSITAKCTLTPVSAVSLDPVSLDPVSLAYETVTLDTQRLMGDPMFRSYVSRGLESSSDLTPVFLRSPLPILRGLRGLCRLQKQHVFTTRWVVGHHSYDQTKDEEWRI